MKNGSLIVPLALAVAVLGPTTHAHALDPIETLKHAGAVCDAATAYTYTYQYEGHGSLAGHYRGSVRLLQGDTTTPTRIWVQTFVTTEAGESEFITLTDGSTTTVTDVAARTVTTGTAARGGSHLMFHIFYSVLFQFVQPGAYQFEVAEGAPVAAGTREVGGVPCEVVRVRSPFGATVDWSFGERDHFPRAQRWTNEQPGQEGGFEFTIADLNFEAKLTTADFTLETSDGFAVIDDDARTVAVGKAAPEWRATNTRGEEMSSDQARDAVVVLDFWASWCPPCWTVMPAIEKLAAEYADRPVRFVGVNVWESDQVNAGAYVKQKGFTYDQILKGEALATAFKMNTLPAVIVIGRDRRIAFLEVGGAGTAESVLRAQIKAALATLPESDR